MYFGEVHGKTLLRFGFGLWFLVGLISCASVQPNPIREEDWTNDSLKLNNLWLPGSKEKTRGFKDAEPNARITQFVQKCTNGKNLKVGFIGGSITEGAGADPLEHRFSTRLVDLLRKSYPKSRFSEINAGVSATPSRYACSRLQSDLLEKKPDLILVDFAVNDASFHPTWVQGSVEGLIRHIYKKSSAAVIFITFSNIYGDGRAHILHRQVTHYYGIPLLSWRDAFLPLIDEKKIKRTQIFSDEAHPNEMGHALASKLILSYLKSQEKTEIKRPEVLPLVRFSLALDSVTSLYEQAGIWALRPSPFTWIGQRDWAQSTGQQEHLYLQSGTVGAELEFAVHSRELTLGIRSRKDLRAKLEVQVDSLITDTIENHFEYDWGGGYMRLNPIFLKEKEETTYVKLKLLQGQLTIEKILWAGKNKDTKGTNYYFKDSLPKLDSIESPVP